MLQFIATALSLVSAFFNFFSPQEHHFPDGYPSTISPEFAWLKGTAWSWNGRVLKFHVDGSVETGDCKPGQCKWSSEDDTVYMIIGESLLAWQCRGARIPDANANAESLRGLKLDGYRESDMSRQQAVFSEVFDTSSRTVENDLYAILGLQGPDVDASEIKKVFRTLSLKYHPDKNPEPAAAAKFHEAKRASDILSDPVKKLLYDIGGIESVKSAENGQVRKDRDLNFEIEVDLAQMYSGTELVFEFNRRVVCAGCKGQCSGCKRCPNEVKTVRHQVAPGFYMQQQIEVQSDYFCKNVITDLKVTVQPGAMNGDTIVVENMGEQTPGVIPGNVVVHIKQKPNKSFSREGVNLKTSIEISLTEALTGFSRTLNHLDGKAVIVANEGVTKPFMTLVIGNEGMPSKTGNGDLLVQVNVKFPKSLSSNQKEQIAKIL